MKREEETRLEYVWEECRDPHLPSSSSASPRIRVDLDSRLTLKYSGDVLGQNQFDLYFNASIGRTWDLLDGYAEEIKVTFWNLRQDE